MAEADLPADPFAGSMVLGVLSHADRADLAGRSSRRTYQRGEIVLCEGEPADALLVLLTGQLKISTYSAEGNEFIVAYVRPGDTIGELGVLSGAPRSATVTATEPSTAVTVAGSVVMELLAQRPAVGMAMLRQLADIVRRTTDVAADLMFLTLDQRLAKFLVDAMTKNPGEELHLTQSELASVVGASRQRVNACLRQFHQQGWIQLRKGQITVVDRAALLGVARD